MDRYNQYLAGKNNPDIWRKAKQHEYKSLEDILPAISKAGTLKFRGAMTERILGLIRKSEPGDTSEAVRTDVGDELLSSTKKQQILDEQLLKINLDSYVNPKSRIPVFPMAIVYEILAGFGSLTFEEYALFVCWINTAQDKVSAMSLIREFRDADNAVKASFRMTLAQKTQALGYDNFNDHIFRLFGLFKLSSFVNAETPGERWLDTLYANSRKETYEELIASLRKIATVPYEDAHTRYLGIITVLPEYSDITREMDNLNPDEKKLVKDLIIERNTLPDISLAEPRAITATFLPVALPEVSPQPGGSKPSVKIDYEKRDKRNRLVGAYGERLVMIYERNRLVATGEKDLADSVEHCSLTDDSLGYDVKSFDATGTEKHIEVKTVSGRPKSVRFYISQNEFENVENDTRHCIYLVFRYNTSTPEILEIGNLREKIEANTAVKTPVNFTVSISLEYQDG